jgi:hypothetical protein
MIRRRMQIKHGRVGLATCRGSILGSAVVLVAMIAAVAVAIVAVIVIIVVAPVIAAMVVVVPASLRFLLRRRSCVVEIQ